jgi:hypothetical protein
MCRIFAPFALNANMIYDILAVSSKYLTNDLSLGGYQEQPSEACREAFALFAQRLEDMFLGYRPRLLLAST